jgi:hypothetical protein
MFGKLFKRFTIVNKNSNNITINGKNVDVPNGSSICMKGGKIYVDGKELDIEGIASDATINIEVVGDVESIECDGSVRVTGNSGSINCGGSSKVGGNVEGSVNAGGSVRIEGNHKGNITAGGSVRTN